jgi:hypothetical protein
MDTKNRLLSFRKWLAAFLSISIIIVLLASCKSNPASSTVTVTVTSPSTTSTLSSSTTLSSTSTPPVSTTTPVVSSTPAIPNITPPQALISSRSALNSADYVVFAWNDLGMHCANPTYDKAVLLPPYNNLWAQVIKRGNPPHVVTTGLTVEYKVINNTYSYGKQSFAQFWDNAKKLFGISLAKDTGLNLSDPNVHNGLSGKMAAKTDHFEAIGIPLTPINDDNSWNPYQVGQVTVKDTSGKILAQTDTTLPISTEINCTKCHGADAFQDVLKKHDAKNGTSLVSQAPVLCAGCHGDPALGTPKKSGVKYLSDAMHGFHSTVSPQPTCYDCHPGSVTQCSRSLAHTSSDGNCTACHGDLAKVSGTITSGRVPWVNEPKCADCHTGAAGVDTQATLYRNAIGHGSVYCAGCHSSPHATVPTSILPDNYQALQYQGAAKAIGSCGACHVNSKGAGTGGDFIETHGGSSPRVANSCAVCHTSVPANTAQWPHAFQWKATQGTGTARSDD